MIVRRQFLTAGTALAALSALPLRRALAASRIVLSGSHEQGGLVIGAADGAASVSVDGQDVNVAGGRFCFGIPYDRTAAIAIEARFADGGRESASVTPIVRQYQVQRINGLPQKFVTPSPEELERIHREAETIIDARKRDTDGVGFSQGFGWPFPGILSSVYGSQRVDNGVPMAPHLGVDIAAPEGTPIHAPADATVSIAADYFLDGGFTLLDHGHGVSTCYLHQSKRMVGVGDHVKKGAVIGLVGMTGRATGPHSHWGLNWFQEKLDPSLLTPTPLPPRA